ncbi:MAG TPA: O-antigen ligase family protein [Chloroflexota bacterium]
MRALGAGWVDRAALVLVVVAAMSLGFDRLEPSLGLTADLRLTNLGLVATLVVVAALLACGLMGRWPPLPRAIAWLTLAWVACLVASAALAPIYQTQALAFVRDMVFGICFGWAVYAVGRSASRATLIARAFAVCGMAVAAIALLEAANVRPVVEFVAGFRNQASFSVGDLPRVASTLPHPNITAMLLGLALPLQLVWIVSSRHVWMRVALALGAAVELIALVLTISRAGILVTELVLLGMLAFGIWRRQSALMLTSLVAAISLPLLFGLAALREPLMLLHLSSENDNAWYRADYSPPAAISADPGGTASVPIRLQNTGDRTWNASGPHPFALSYHLDDASGQSVTYDGVRTPLPLDVAPGASVDLEAQIAAPTAQGTYVIEWDGVQEAVTWFSWAGTPVARTYLSVNGPRVPAPLGAGSEIVVTPPPTALPPPPPARLTLWRIALRMARNRPLLGVGPDNFRWVYGDFAGVMTWDTGSHANSLYFEWLADTGIVALGLFLWLSWRLLRLSFANLSPMSSADWFWAWRLGLAASLAAWFLHGFFDYFYEPLPTNLAFWFVVGLVLAAAEAQRRARWTVAECVSPST